MSYITVTDGSANLPNHLQDGIKILSCDYSIGDAPTVYTGDLDAFDFHAYYEALKNGSEVKTSLLNTQRFIDAFREYLEEGLDIIYLSMSANISGTYQAAKVAAELLMGEYPGRLIHIVDSKTCGLGTGLQAVHSAKLNADGVEIKDAVEILENDVDKACSYFTVDDINFLKRTGRVSGAAAAISTVLDIKPILYGSSNGIIEACAKVRGRKNAIKTLAEKYRAKALDPEKGTVYISHGDCLEDANALAEKIREIKEPANLVICPHEPFSGAHVGPGMLGLFFSGRER